MRPTLFHIISDYGHNAAETGILKALLITNFPECPILQGPQDFSKDNIVPASVYLSLIVDDFPENSVHLIDVFIPENAPEKFVFAKYKNQYFLCPDNGVLSVALDSMDAEFYRIPFLGSYPDPVKDIYIPFLIQWIKKEKGQLDNLKAIGEIRKLIFPTPVISGNRILLSVIYTDAQGNAYLNIKKEEWESLILKRPFKLKITKNNFLVQISPGYNSVSEGQILALFGLGGYLQIAQHRGSARTLLGLECDRQLFLEIEATGNIAM